MNSAEREHHGLVKIDIPSLILEKEAFHSRIIGQEEAVDAFATLYAKLKSGIRSSHPGPKDIKFLAGPSGVGKTEIVLALADLLAEGKDNPRSKVVKLNCGEYQESHMVARLVGAPPGYRDSGETTLFSQNFLDENAIAYQDTSGREQKVTLILVDEAEKAHADLHRAFLGVLDKGEMTVGKDNERTDFSDTVILYTSNVGNEQVERFRAQHPGENEKVKEIGADAFKNAFPPEFRGRIKDLIFFRNLSKDEIQQIALKKITQIENNFAENGIAIRLKLRDRALEWVRELGYNPSEGVRALEKVIERFIHDKLIIANVGISIHGKSLVADIEEGDAELSFFYKEGEIVERDVQQSQINPEMSPRKDNDKTSVGEQNPSGETLVRAGSSVPQPVLEGLVHEMQTYGVHRYSSKMQQYINAGVVTKEAANSLSEVRVAAADRIRNQMIYGVRRYTDERDQLVRAGVFTVEEANGFEFIHEAAASRLREKLQYGIGPYANERDQLVDAGIGSVEYWNNIILNNSA